MNEDTLIWKFSQLNMGHAGLVHITQRLSWANGTLPSFLASIDAGYLDSRMLRSGMDELLYQDDS